MLIGYKRGQGSIIIRVKILNSSVTTGAGLTGLTNTSTGLIISTIADTESSATAYTVAASNVETITTNGTYAAPTSGKCRFKELDATNHKGVYEIQIADARYNVSSAKFLLVSVSGATNAAETDVVIPLRDLDPYDAVRAGLTSLPNVASGSAGAIITSGTGTAQLSVSSGLVTLAAVTHTGATIPTVTSVTNRVSANTDQWNGVSVTGMPMPTYTQPTGFLTATFPTTVASTTNITSASGVTLASSQTFSTTGSVGSVTGAVGSVTGAVGSVTGNVGGNVVGSVASVTNRVTANTDQLAGQTVTAAAGVTFPTSVASPTNITSASGVTLAAVTHTGATIPTVSTVTNGVTVTTNSDKTGYSLTQTFPTNFSSLAITVGGAVTVGTNSDKTGYSLTQAFPTNFSSLAITAGGSVTAGTVSDKTGYSLTQTFPTNFAALGINASGHVSRVTLVDTTTTNTDMRGTDSAALASAWTATRAGYLDSVLIAANANQRTVSVTGSQHVAAVMHDSEPGSIHATSFDAGAIDAAALATDAATEIATATLGATIEGSETLTQSVRLMRAALVGKLAGAATTTVTIRDAADSKARITATVDADGNRTAVTTDAT